jgi:hypothetical protein
VGVGEAERGAGAMEGEEAGVGGVEGPAGGRSDVGGKVGGGDGGDGAGERGAARGRADGRGRRGRERGEEERADVGACKSWKAGGGAGSEAAARQSRAELLFWQRRCHTRSIGAAGAGRARTGEAGEVDDGGGGGRAAEASAEEGGRHPYIARDRVFRLFEARDRGWVLPIVCVGDWNPRSADELCSGATGDGRFRLEMRIAEVGGRARIDMSASRPTRRDSARSR